MSVKMNKKTSQKHPRHYRL